MVLFMFATSPSGRYIYIFRGVGLIISMVFFQLLRRDESIIETHPHAHCVFGKLSVVSIRRDCFCGHSGFIMAGSCGDLVLDRPGKHKRLTAMTTVESDFGSITLLLVKYQAAGEI